MAKNSREPQPHFAAGLVNARRSRLSFLGKAGCARVNVVDCSVRWVGEWEKQNSGKRDTLERSYRQRQQF
jgi:hypothetical protein